MDEKNLNIVAICDNYKVGSLVEGIKVLSVEDIKDIKYDRVIISVDINENVCF